MFEEFPDVVQRVDEAFSPKGPAIGSVVADDCTKERISTCWVSKKRRLELTKEISTMYKHGINKSQKGGRDKNGDKLSGKTKVDGARENDGTGKPRDGRSAKFSREGT